MFRAYTDDLRPGVPQTKEPAPSASTWFLESQAVKLQQFRFKLRTAQTVIRAHATSTSATTSSVVTGATGTTAPHHAYTLLQPLQEAQQVISTTAAPPPPAAVSAVSLKRKGSAVTHWRSRKCAEISIGSSFRMGAQGRVDQKRKEKDALGRLGRSRL
uniref:Uncharacterized protein n=1 Tax=Ixodes ricinus TaxID=34613 RepID=A0A6B0UWE9_IXORI